MKQTDIREGFIIKKINNIPVNTVDEFIIILNSLQESILLEGSYEGTPGTFYYAFEK